MLLVTSILILVLFPYSAKIRHSPTYFPRVKKVKVTGKNKKGKKLSKTLKCAVTVKTPKITAAPAQTVKVGATASVKPSVKPASAKLSYKSSDAAVAAVDANGVVTGVAAGKATVSVTAKVGTKTLTATTDVTVEADETVMSEVKQYSSRGFTATFTDDASKLFTKDDIVVEAADKTDALAVKSVEFAADGKSANVTLLKDFTDGVSYNVTAKGVTLTLAAKVGAVATVKINTTSAQQNVKTPVEFSLFDASGIDVTPATDLDAKCSVSVDGSYTDASISNAAKATITMGTIGDKATVTVIYNSGAKDAQDITATQEITCVDAKAVLGTLVFANAKKDGHLWVNNNSDCAKFYLGLSDEKASVEVGGENNNVYFYAKASDGEAVAYDSYTVEAADDDVVSVSAPKDTGKFVKLNLSGLKAGNTKVNIKATKNGKDTLYTIPVEVYEIGDAVKMTVELKMPTMTNAYENDYSGKIECRMYDANNREIPDDRTSFEAEVAKKTGTPIQVVPDGHKDFKATAEGADAGNYTVKFTGVDSKSGKTFNRSATIRVEDILKAVQTANEKGTGLKLDYQLELNKTTIDQNPCTAWDQDVNKKIEVKVKAVYGGKFVGYVTYNTTGSAIMIGDGTGSDKVDANDDTELTDVKIGAKLGTKLFAGNTDLMNTSTTTGAFITIGAAEKTTFKTVDADGGTVYYTGDTNKTLAKTGAYTIECRLVYRNAKKNTSGTGSNKYAPLTKTITVKNSMAIPTVKVGAKTVDSVSTDSDIFDVLTTNVDMNQDDEAKKSFDTGIGLVKEINAANPAAAKTAATSADGKKLTVKYVVVEDSYTLGWNDETTQTWKFYVPINTTFTQR